MKPQSRSNQPDAKSERLTTEEHTESQAPILLSGSLYAQPDQLKAFRATILIHSPQKLLETFRWLSRARHQGGRR